MTRIIRKVLVSLSAITLILTLSAPITSNNMQGYYKELISEMPENTQVLLEKKQFWATLGETKLFLILFLIFLFCFLISEMIIWIKKYHRHCN
jgi:hypothetical protein